MNISGSGKRKTGRISKRSSFIYYSKPKIKTETHINWRLLWFSLEIIIPLFLLIYVYYFSPFFKVKDIIVSGNEKISSEAIESKIPRDVNIFSFNILETENNIKKDIPEIQEVKIYKGIPNAIKVIIKEQKPEILWQSGIQYYLVNNVGIAYEDVSSSISEYQQLARVLDQRSLPVSLQDQIVSNHFVIFANKIFSTIKEEANIDPDYFAVDETTVDLSLYTKNGFYIKFDTLRQAEAQLNNLKLVLAQKRDSVHEYVDLRVNGWVYIK